ncbi:hypothetical protein [Bradyrhizobium elkanii]|uniref:hypothetical protein n=1 Tax=Bradyrhizobium elkanii TaxID=29448 RepID=UPI003D2523E3
MSTAFIDFKDLKAAVRIDDVAKWLGLALGQPKNGTYRIDCPKCESARALAISPEHVRKDGTVGSFFCQSSKTGGDAIELVRYMRGVEKQQEAARMIAEQFRFIGRAGNTPAKRDKTPEEPRERQFDPEAYAARLDPAHEGLNGLCVSPQTLRDFKAGFSSGGVHRGKLALPLHDHDGKLIGHFSRSLKGESPLLTFFSGHNPADYIFGSNLVEAGELYVAADPLDVLTAYENGVTNVVAFLTDGITPQQWEMLSSLMDRKKVERSYLWK